MSVSARFPRGHNIAAGRFEIHTLPAAGDKASLSDQSPHQVLL